MQQLVERPPLVHPGQDAARPGPDAAIALASPRLTLEAQLQAAVQLAAPPAEHEPAAGDLRALAVNVAHEAMARLRDDLADRERQLVERCDELVRLRAEAEGVTSVAEEHLHVLFIRTESGFSLLERPGPAPAVGETVEVDGNSEHAGHFVVRTHGRAGDGGPRCAYVERV